MFVVERQNQRVIRVAKVLWNPVFRDVMFAMWDTGNSYFSCAVCAFPGENNFAAFHPSDLSQRICIICAYRYHSKTLKYIPTEVQRNILDAYLKDPTKPR